jgi:succinyl-CoA synthetase beta subunit
MYVYEHQAKEILSGYGVPLARGSVATSAEAAERAARELDGDGCVVKAQILAGGRGRAGGVRTAPDPAAARTAAEALLGQRLATAQTSSEGQRVKTVYVEELVAADRSLYLGLLIDRSAGRVAVIATAEGGEDIEERVAADPELLRRVLVDPRRGPEADELRRLADELRLDGAAAEGFVALAGALYRAFVELDANLIEINPLAVLPGGALIAVDVKMGFDDNALFRHPEIKALRDEDEIDPVEIEAARYEVNYVKLDGDIGCVVSGAGLALATLDLIHKAGGKPADFMDVRPVASREQIATAFGLILRNPNVRAILVNMFGGGILRCDTMAEGIAAAAREIGLTVPLIVRAAGTNHDIAAKVLVSQGIPVAFETDMGAAARHVVAAAQRGSA